VFAIILFAPNLGEGCSPLLQGEISKRNCDNRTVLCNLGCNNFYQGYSFYRDELVQRVVLVNLVNFVPVTVVVVEEEGSKGVLGGDSGRLVYEGCGSSELGIRVQLGWYPEGVVQGRCLEHHQLDGRERRVQGGGSLRGGVCTSRVFSRLGKAVSGDVKKVGKGISKFISSKSGLSSTVEGMKEGFSTAGSAASKVADFTKQQIKSANKSSKMSGSGGSGSEKDGSSKSKWDSDLSEYESPQLVGLPSKDLYCLSMDEKQLEGGTVLH